METSISGENREQAGHEPRSTATSSRVADDNVEKRSSLSNAVAREGAPPKQSVCEHRVANQVFASIPVAQDSQASTACHSRPRSTNTASGTQAVRSMSESHSEPPYHVLTRKRKYMFVTKFIIISTYLDSRQLYSCVAPAQSGVARFSSSQLFPPVQQHLFPCIGSHYRYLENRKLTICDECGHIHVRLSLCHISKTVCL